MFEGLNCGDPLERRPSTGELLNIPRTSAWLGAQGATGEVDCSHERARQGLERDGVAVIPAVFSRSEIGTLRHRVALVASRPGEKGDLLSIPELRHCLLDPRLARVVKALLGSRPVYYGDSSFQYEAPVRTMIFHKDAISPGDSRYEPRYGIVRIAIFLQDCRAYSGGLSVRIGSHRTPSLTTGKPQAIPSAEGDLVAFYLNTTHAGFSTRLRFVPNWCPPLWLQRFAIARGSRYAPKGMFRAMQREPRAALFMSFGVAGRQLESYLANIYSKRAWARARFEESPPAAQTASLLMPLGYETIDLAQYFQPARG